MKAIKMTMARDFRTRRFLPICVRCGHIFIKTDDKNKRICFCDNPVLYPTRLAMGMSNLQLKQLPQFKFLLKEA